MKLVGICGDIGSGKDTVADQLARHHGFHTLSFADQLKRWVFDLVEPLGVERRHIFGGSAETKQADNAEPLTFLGPRNEDTYAPEAAFFPGEFWTGRSRLEHLGTNVARAIHPDVWVLHVERMIQKKQNSTRQFEGELRFVIADVRFPNEFAAIERMKGEVWRTRLLVAHGMDLRGTDEVREIDLDGPCPAGDDWRDSCHCGAIRSTSHESDEVWRHLEFTRMLSAKKPGEAQLRKLASATYEEMIR